MPSPSSSTSRKSRGASSAPPPAPCTRPFWRPTAPARVSISKNHSNSVLDVDMGGGTTKISLIRGGEIAQMVATRGRRAPHRPRRRPDHHSRRAARPHHHEWPSGHEVEVGAKLTEEQRDQFVEKMTDILFDVISGGDVEPLTESLLLTSGLDVNSLHEVDHVVLLRRRLRVRLRPHHGILWRRWPLLRQACARNAPWGPSAPGVLITPRRGHSRHRHRRRPNTPSKPAAAPATSPPTTCSPFAASRSPAPSSTKEQAAEEMESAIAAAVGKYDLDKLSSNMVLAMSISGQPDYWYIRRLAEFHRQVRSRRALRGPRLPRRRRGRRQVPRRHHQRGDRPGPSCHRHRRHRGRRPRYVDVGKPMGASEVIPVTVSPSSSPSAPNRVDPTRQWARRKRSHRDSHKGWAGE